MTSLSDTLQPTLILFYITLTGLLLMLFGFLFGFTHLIYKPRDNQDMRIIYFQILFALFCALYNAEQISFLTNEGSILNISCNTHVKLFQLFLCFSRLSMFGFLLTKVASVYYTEKNTTKGFKFLKYSPIAYVFWTCVVVFYPGVVWGDVIYSPEISASICKVSYVTLPIFFLGGTDAAISITALYYFLKPLREITKTATLPHRMSNSSSQQVSHHKTGGRDLHSVIRRNFWSSFVAINVTIGITSIVGLVNLVTTNYAIIVLASVSLTVDALVNSIALWFCSKSGWVYNEKFSLWLGEMSNISRRSNPESNKEDRKSGLQVESMVRKLSSDKFAASL